MFYTNFVTQLMKESLSDEFLSQLVVGYLKIQKEEFAEANTHFNKMLYTSHNSNDDDILWMAKAHIYKKLGKKEESQTCINRILDAFGYVINF